MQIGPVPARMSYKAMPPTTFASATASSTVVKFPSVRSDAADDPNIVDHGDTRASPSLVLVVQQPPGVGIVVLEAMPKQERVLRRRAGVVVRAEAGVMHDIKLELCRRRSEQHS